MPLDIPQLDDRRFDDLVAEAQARLATHVPEWRNMAPGDPALAFVDVFAWLTETILYRANLIPERQRRAFLNLLSIPLRAAEPARGVVSIDWITAKELPKKLLPAGTELAAGDVTVSTTTEVVPLPLELSVLVKRVLTRDDLEHEGIRSEHLAAQYPDLARGATILPFRPTLLRVGRDAVTVSKTVDGCFYFALGIAEAWAGEPAPPTSKPEHWNDKVEALREHLAGETLSLALAPDDSVAESDVPVAGKEATRRLEFAWCWLDGNTPRWLPLELVHDGTVGGRRTGVVQLRLPHALPRLAPPGEEHPLNYGRGDTPPELPAGLPHERLFGWIRVRATDDPELAFGYCGVNGVAVVAQTVERDVVLGMGERRPDQTFALPHSDVDPASVRLDVATGDGWQAWRRIEHFGGAGRDARVFTVDGEAGVVRFGDGVRGALAPEGRLVRAVEYRRGGGARTNLAPGTIRALVNQSGDFKVRHEHALFGGIDAESVAEAERRIGAFLAHNGRAVTVEDYRALARETPTVRVARAEVLTGFVPTATPSRARTNVPGAVSVFALPDAECALANSPRPNRAFLREVFDYLGERKVLGTELYVLSPEFVPIAVSVAVHVTDPANERTVLRAIERALVVHLWALAPHGPSGSGWPLGRAVRVNELEAVVARVPGVLSVEGLALYRKDEAGNWVRTPVAVELALLEYQLPELTVVELGVGDAPAEPSAWRDPDPSAPAPVPVPVVPELC